MEYILIGIAVLTSFLYLVKKLKKEIKKGQCASCPLYDKCESKDKV